MESKFKKFEPMSPTANQKILDLVKRGGIIVTERRDYVLVQRLESVAKIDQYGRVEWTSANDIR
jgi:hypothetical protein